MRLACGVSAFIAGYGAFFAGAPRGADSFSVNFSTCDTSPRTTAVATTAPSVNGTIYSSAALKDTPLSAVLVTCVDGTRQRLNPNSRPGKTQARGHRRNMIRRDRNEDDAAQP